MSKTIKRLLSLTLCIVLCAAMALVAIGCEDNTVQPTEAPAADTPTDEPVADNGKSFTVEVTYADGTTDTFTYKSEKQFVGETLLEEKLIEGEEGQYGLYVKSVNGVTADYDTDGTYWAFYINGEYAATGVDATEIVDGTVYGFKVEKG